MNIKSLLGDHRVYTVAALRLLAAPMLSLAILLALDLIPGITVTNQLAMAMLMATGVSTAASTSAMAKSHGIEGSLAAAATLVNTLLCVITLPLLCLLFGAIFI